MAFIEAHQSLRDHRKIVQIAFELDMPEVYVAGHCLYLWLWSLDNAQDGVLPASHRIIERAAAWAGTPGALVQAMLQAEMLETDDQGHIVIHDWYDYAGRLMESRKANQKQNYTLSRAYKDGTIDAVKGRDGSRCRYCGTGVDWADRKTIRGGTYDAIDPSKPPTRDNLVVACRGCSLEKGSRSLEESGMTLLPIGSVNAKSNSVSNAEPNPVTEVSNAEPNPPNPAFNPHLTTVPNRTVTDLKDLSGGGDTRVREDDLTAPTKADGDPELHTLLSRIYEAEMGEKPNQAQLKALSEWVDKGMDLALIRRGLNDASIKKKDLGYALGTYSRQCERGITTVAQAEADDAAREAAASRPRARPTKKGNSQTRSQAAAADERYANFFKQYPGQSQSGGST